MKIYSHPKQRYGPTHVSINHLLKHSETTEIAKVTINSISQGENPSFLSPLRVDVDLSLSRDFFIDPGLERKFLVRTNHRPPLSRLHLMRRAREDRICQLFVHLHWKRWHLLHHLWHVIQVVQDGEDIVSSFAQDIDILM